MQNRPLVTIGIPTLNRLEMLVRAVQSVLAQDYPNLEVVVCDNASNPMARNALEPFLHDQRLRYVYYEDQVDMVSNWNRCLDLARGDFWLCLSDDDWMEPDAVSELIAGFEESDVGMVVCSRYMITEQECVRSEVSGDGIVSGWNYICDRLQGRGGGCPAAEMFRTELVRGVRGYQNIGFAMDLVLELDAGVSGAVGYIRKPLVHYAIHSGNASVTRPLEYIQSHVTLAELSPKRYPPQVASEVIKYCLDAVYGRLKAGALDCDRSVTQAGRDALIKLKAPIAMQTAAQLLNCIWAQYLLHHARIVKRRLVGRRRTK